MPVCERFALGQCHAFLPCLTHGTVVLLSAIA